ncbi:PepSY domain-containing protein [Streptomyces sp. NPDC008222]|uniref:PepSY domain-containing protein n=1 Tax=Streptomyces sp. NPDC008222 TaxID=3364820 RepID=UPI0036E9432D
MNALKRPLTGRRRTMATVLAATVVLGGAGAATAVAFADEGDHDSSHAAASTHRGDQGGTTEDSADDGSAAATATSTKTNLKQAADAAVKSVPGTVTAVELEAEHSKTIWKVDIRTDKGAGHEVTVNAADGTVTGNRADQGDDAPAKPAKTGLGQAVDAALNKVQGIATSAHLEADNGRSAAWHVEVTDAKGAEHEITVDAESGKVTAAQADADHGHSADNGTDDDDREED